MISAIFENLFRIENKCDRDIFHWVDINTCDSTSARMDGSGIASDRSLASKLDQLMWCSAQRIFTFPHVYQDFTLFDDWKQGRKKSPIGGSKGNVHWPLEEEHSSHQPSIERVLTDTFSEDASRR